MVEISNDSSFGVGAWWVEPKANRLSRDGETVTIEPRVMELLVYLAGHAGEVVSSEDIFRQVWPNVVVGDNSLYRGIAQIRKVLGDSTTEPQYIATIPKRGYRLIAEVHAAAPIQAARPGQRDATNAAADVGTRWSPRALLTPHRTRILAGAILFVASAVGLWALFAENKPPEPGDKTTERLTSIAVLPFTNVSDDPGNDYFALGLSDELLNTLGQVRDIDVVARTSSYSFKNLEDVRQIGRRLNVEGIVEGSVRKAGNKIRVNVQLIDTESGFDRWSGEYNRDLDDIFAIQKEIADSILAALSEQLDIAPPLDAPSPAIANIEAYELYLLGRHYVRPREPAGLKRAASLYQFAIWRDESYAPAYSGIAEAYLLQAEYGDLPLTQALKLAEPMLDKAMALNENLAEPYAIRGLARFLEHRYEEAQTALEAAIKLNPSDAMAHMWLGLSLAFHEGRLNDAQRLYERGLSLDPLNVTLAMNIAYNLSRLGRSSEALDRLEAASKLNPETMRIQLGIAQVAADVGRFDIAHRAAMRILALKPGSARAMTLLAYIYANLGDLEAAELWITKTEQSGEQTSIWYLQMARAAVYLKKGEQVALAALLKAQSAHPVKPDPLLFFTPRVWRPYGAVGTGQMLVGAYPAAAEYFERYLRSMGRVQVTQRFEDVILYLVNYAYVQEKIGAPEAFREILKQASAVMAQARQDGWNTNALAFEEARLHALEGEPEQALADLERAIKQGYPSLWWLEHDPIWQGFTEDEKFRELTVGLQERLTELLRQIRASGDAAAAQP